MMPASLTRKLCIATALLWLAGSTQAAEPVAPTDELDLSCGPPPAGHPVKGRRDYRLMLQNTRDLRDVRYHETFHIKVAQQQIRSGGNLSWDVMNNLHFVLHKVPNDPRALALLIEFDAAGGRDKRYSPPACYFIWARQFVPDDSTVWTYGGYFFYRRKDTNRAEQWWEQAIAVDPGNSEAHYNLGLLNFDLGRYADARTHAWTAYEAGYPLPGLRDKLAKAGQWQEPPATGTTSE